MNKNVYTQKRYSSADTESGKDRKTAGGADFWEKDNGTHSAPIIHHRGQLVAHIRAFLTTVATETCPSSKKIINFIFAKDKLQCTEFQHPIWIPLHSLHQAIKNHKLF